LFSCSVGVVISNGLCCADTYPYPNANADPNPNPNPDTNANCSGGVHLEMV